MAMEKENRRTKKYTMGIDIGTGGVRVGIFTLAGEAVVFSTSDVGSAVPGPGMTEQEPSDWWKALVESTHKALEKSGIGAEEICGVGISSTVSTLLLLGKDMEVLRPALMWCDVRATKQAERIAAAGDPALKYNGHGNVSAEWGLPKMLWLNHIASQSMVQYQSTISPDAENHRRYQFYLKKYEEAYVLMKDWMHEVSSYSLK